MAKRPVTIPICCPTFCPIMDTQTNRLLPLRVMGMFLGTGVRKPAVRGSRSTLRTPLKSDPLLGSWIVMWYTYLLWCMVAYWVTLLAVFRLPSSYPPSDSTQIWALSVLHSWTNLPSLWILLCCIPLTPKWVLLPLRCKFEWTVKSYAVLIVGLGSLLMWLSLMLVGVFG